MFIKNIIDEKKRLYALIITTLIFLIFVLFIINAVANLDEVWKHVVNWTGAVLTLTLFSAMMFIYNRSTRKSSATLSREYMDNLKNKKKY